MNNFFERIYNSTLENIIIQSKKTYKKLFDINYDDILLLIKNWATGKINFIRYDNRIKNRVRFDETFI